MSQLPAEPAARPKQKAAGAGHMLRGALASLVQVVLAAGIGLAIGAIMMNATGYDWKEAYHALWIGSFGDRWGLFDTLADATPLILTGLTFGLCFRAGYFNIGAQGQMIIGALVAVAVGSSLGGVPTLVAVPLVVLAAGIAGAIWSMPAALLKVTRGVHEVISTIMFNWIAIYLSGYLVFNVMNDPRSAERTVRVAENVRMSALLPGADATSALFISVFIAVFFYWLLYHSPWGYEMRVAGFSHDALRYAGANPMRAVNVTFLLAGLASGIAGATQIIGRPPTYALYGDLSNLGNFGFDGIAVALIGRSHPLGTILAAVFFGALSTGARMMQIIAGVPLDMIRVVHGVIIVALAAPELWSILRRSISRRVASRTAPAASGPAAGKGAQQ